MKFKVLTLFPDFIESVRDYGVLGRALDNNIIDMEVKNIRDYSLNKHKKVDDEIYGGGAGMLMTPQPIYDALQDVKDENSLVIYMSPQGKVLNQEICKELDLILSPRSEEHTSELQSRFDLVCRLLLEKKKK